MSAQTSTDLENDLLEKFRTDGYVVLPGFLPPDLLARLRPEVDHWVDSGLRRRSIDACRPPGPVPGGPPPFVEIELPAHGELAAHPPLLRVLCHLIGPDFVFHHLHSDRRGAAAPGKDWHHDYEQRPQRDRRVPMAHALHYIGGLDPSMDPLAVLPGSHREVVGKTARAHLGTGELPGEVVIDDLPPGSTVLLHSALFHARRAAPEPAGGFRYMIDGSYCRTGVKWPPVKPYWRHVLATARRLGLDRGEWPELFNDAHFTEYEFTGYESTGYGGQPR
ncbi:phytanoyl-CoA dioxygenase family protein [Streptomyces uncialis]|uniref:phytanoyl-CoA dioxygenase family protein n=1 Tax=Streptomyces uncialis TaxID=1048205 RepID=UPI0038107D5D